MDLLSSITLDSLQWLQETFGEGDGLEKDEFVDVLQKALRGVGRSSSNLKKLAANSPSSSSTAAAEYSSPTDNCSPSSRSVGVGGLGGALQRWTRQALTSLFYEIDYDNNGSVSWSEFTSFVIACGESGGGGGSGSGSGGGAKTASMAAILGAAAAAEEEAYGSTISAERVGLRLRSDPPIFLRQCSQLGKLVYISEAHKFVAASAARVTIHDASTPANDFIGRAKVSGEMLDVCYHPSTSSLVISSTKGLVEIFDAAKGLSLHRTFTTLCPISTFSQLVGGANTLFCGDTGGRIAAVDATRFSPLAAIDVSPALSTTYNASPSYSPLSPSAAGAGRSTHASTARARVLVPSPPSQATLTAGRLNTARVGDTLISSNVLSGLSPRHREQAEPLLMAALMSSSSRQQRRGQNASPQSYDNSITAFQPTTTSSSPSVLSSSSASSGGAITGVKSCPLKAIAQYSLPHHTATVTALSYVGTARHSLTQTLLTTAMDNVMTLVDVEAATVMYQLPSAHASYIKGISINPFRSVVLTYGGDHFAGMTTLSSQHHHMPPTLVDSIVPHSSRLVGVVCCDADDVITADMSGMIKLWDLRMMRCVQTCIIPQVLDPSYASSGGAATIAGLSGVSGSGTNNIGASTAGVGTTLSGQTLSKIVPKRLLPAGIAYNPLTQQLFALGPSVSVFDRLQRKVSTASHAEPLVAMAYNPANMTLVSCTPTDIAVWNAQSGVCTVRYTNCVSGPSRGGTITCVSVDMLQDGRRVLVGTSTGYVVSIILVSGVVMWSYRCVDEQVVPATMRRIAFCEAAVDHNIIVGIGSGCVKAFREAFLLVPSRLLYVPPALVPVFGSVGEDTHEGPSEVNNSETNTNKFTKTNATLRVSDPTSLMLDKTNGTARSPASSPQAPSLNIDKSPGSVSPLTKRLMGGVAVPSVACPTSTNTNTTATGSGGTKAFDINATIMGTFGPLCPTQQHGSNGTVEARAQEGDVKMIGERAEQQEGLSVIAAIRKKRAEEKKMLDEAMALLQPDLLSASAYSVTCGLLVCAFSIDSSLLILSTATRRCHARPSDPRQAHAPFPTPAPSPSLAVQKTKNPEEELGGGGSQVRLAIKGDAAAAAAEILSIAFILEHPWDVIDATKESPSSFPGSLSLFATGDALGCVNIYSVRAHDAHHEVTTAWLITLHTIGNVPCHSLACVQSRFLSSGTEAGSIVSWDLGPLVAAVSLFDCSTVEGGGEGGQKPGGGGEYRTATSSPSVGNANQGNKKKTATETETNNRLTQQQASSSKKERKTKKSNKTNTQKQKRKTLRKRGVTLEEKIPSATKSDGQKELIFGDESHFSTTPPLAKTNVAESTAPPPPLKRIESLQLSSASFNSSPQRFREDSEGLFSGGGGSGGSAGGFGTSFRVSLQKHKQLRRAQKSAVFQSIKGIVDAEGKLPSSSSHTHNDNLLDQEKTTPNEYHLAGEGKGLAVLGQVDVMSGLNDDGTNDQSSDVKHRRNSNNSSQASTSPTSETSRSSSPGSSRESNLTASNSEEESLRAAAKEENDLAVFPTAKRRLEFDRLSSGMDRVRLVIREGGSLLADTFSCVSRALMAASASPRLRRSTSVGDDLLESSTTNPNNITNERRQKAHEDALNKTAVCGSSSRRTIPPPKPLSANLLTNSSGQKEDVDIVYEEGECSASLLGFGIGRSSPRNVAANKVSNTIGKIGDETNDADKNAKKFILPSRPALYRALQSISRIGIGNGKDRAEFEAFAAAGNATAVPQSDGNNSENNVLIGSDSSLLIPKPIRIVRGVFRVPGMSQPDGSEGNEEEEDTNTPAAAVGTSTTTRAKQGQGGGDGVDSAFRFSTAPTAFCVGLNMAGLLAVATSCLSPTIMVITPDGRIVGPLCSSRRDELHAAHSQPLPDIGLEKDSRRSTLAMIGGLQKEQDPLSVNKGVGYRVLGDVLTETEAYGGLTRGKEGQGLIAGSARETATESTSTLRGQPAAGSRSRINSDSANTGATTGAGGAKGSTSGKVLSDFGLPPYNFNEVTVTSRRTVKTKLSGLFTACLAAKIGLPGATNRQIDCDHRDHQKEGSSLLFLFPSLVYLAESYPYMMTQQQPPALEGWGKPRTVSSNSNRSGRPLSSDSLLPATRTIPNAGGGGEGGGSNTSIVISATPTSPKDKSHQANGRRSRARSSTMFSEEEEEMSQRVSPYIATATREVEPQGGRPAKAKHPTPARSSSRGASVVSVSAAMAAAFSIIGSTTTTTSTPTAASDDGGGEESMATQRGGAKGASGAVGRADRQHPSHYALFAGEFIDNRVVDIELGRLKVNRAANRRHRKEMEAKEAKAAELLRTADLSLLAAGCGIGQRQQQLHRFLRSGHEIEMTVASVKEFDDEKKDSGVGPTAAELVFGDMERRRRKSLVKLVQTSGKHRASIPPEDARLLLPPTPPLLRDLLEKEGHLRARRAAAAAQQEKKRQRNTKKALRRMSQLQPSSLSISMRRRLSLGLAASSSSAEYARGGVEGSSDVFDPFAHEYDMSSSSASSDEEGRSKRESSKNAARNAATASSPPTSTTKAYFTKRRMTMRFGASGALAVAGSDSQRNKGHTDTDNEHNHNNDGPSTTSYSPEKRRGSLVAIPAGGNILTGKGGAVGIDRQRTSIVGTTGDILGITSSGANYVNSTANSAHNRLFEEHHTRRAAYEAVLDQQDDDEDSDGTSPYRRVGGGKISVTKRNHKAPPTVMRGGGVPNLTNVPSNSVSSPNSSSPFVGAALKRTTAPTQLLGAPSLVEGGHRDEEKEGRDVVIKDKTLLNKSKGLQTNISESHSEAPIRLPHLVTPRSKGDDARTATANTTSQQASPHSGSGMMKVQSSSPQPPSFLPKSPHERALADLPIEMRDAIRRIHQRNHGHLSPRVQVISGGGSSTDELAKKRCPLSSVPVPSLSLSPLREGGNDSNLKKRSQTGQNGVGLGASSTLPQDGGISTFMKTPTTPDRSGGGLLLSISSRSVFVAVSAIPSPPSPRNSGGLSTVTGVGSVSPPRTAGSWSGQKLDGSADPTSTLKDISVFSRLTTASPPAVRGGGDVLRELKTSSREEDHLHDAASTEVSARNRK